jgi:uncharacterized membrane protein YoaK (UPF0700 family)
MKNGLTTWATHGKIRTTHLTGLSTDIGLHLLKTLKIKNDQSRYPESRKVNYVRILTLVSFSLGACLSAILVPFLGYKIFHFAFVMSIGLSILAILDHYKINKLAQIQEPPTLTEETYANSN